MSRAVEATIVLPTSPERVWRTVMDPCLLERWVTAHDSISEAEPGPATQGDTFTQKLRLAGKSFEVDWTVVEAEPPHRARWSGRGPAGSRASVSYLLQEEDQTTRFDYSNEFALPGGPLGTLAGGLLSAAPGKREAQRSLDRLRELLEREAG
jgi:uncharacterized protein YndB with AHSA1/START domain